MGSGYTLYKNDFTGKELFICEHSNEFDFCLNEDTVTTDKEVSINSLSPEQTLEIFLKGIQVCSYWMDTDELKKKVKAFIEKEIY